MSAIVENDVVNITNVFEVGISADVLDQFELSQAVTCHSLGGNVIHE